MLPIILTTISLLINTSQVNHKRLLYLYATNATVQQLKEQQRLLDADAIGLRERDIVVKTIIKSSSNSTLFTQHKITAPFTLILIGKDGGEKLRTTQTVLLPKLYRLIDAMPMRKLEMKH